MHCKGLIQLIKLIIETQNKIKAQCKYKSRDRKLIIPEFVLNIFLFEKYKTSITWKILNTKSNSFESL